MATKEEMKSELDQLQVRRSQIMTDDWISGVGNNGRSVQFGDRVKQIELIDRRINELKIALGIVSRGYLVGRR